MNVLAIATATGSAIVAGSIYYILLSRQVLAMGSHAPNPNKPPAWLFPVEVVRSGLISVLIAGLTAQIGITSVPGALLLGFALWAGLPAVMLAGGAMHEKMPWRIAFLHGGDWLMKMLLIAVIVAAWR